MRQTDHEETPGLGKKIVPAPAPAPEPRKQTRDGTIVVNPDGKFVTNLPPPPPVNIWDFLGRGYSTPQKGN